MSRDILAGGVVIQQDGIKVRGKSRNTNWENGNLSVLNADDNEKLYSSGHRKT